MALVLHAPISTSLSGLHSLTPLWDRSGQSSCPGAGPQNHQRHTTVRAAVAWACRGSAGDLLSRVRGSFSQQCSQVRGDPERFARGGYICCSLRGITSTFTRDYRVTPPPLLEVVVRTNVSACSIRGRFLGIPRDSVDISHPVLSSARVLGHFESRDFTRRFHRTDLRMTPELIPAGGHPRSQVTLLLLRFDLRVRRKTSGAQHPGFIEP